MIFSLKIKTGPQVPVFSLSLHRISPLIQLFRRTEKHRLEICDCLITYFWLLDNLFFSVFPFFCFSVFLFFRFSVFPFFCFFCFSVFLFFRFSVFLFFCFSVFSCFFMGFIPISRLAQGFFLRCSRVLLSKC
jgi:hypothetical protein